MATRIIVINGYNFEGPYPLISTSFNDMAGVYLITDNPGNYLDVGETETLRTRLASHERKNCWERNKVGSINVWFHSEKDYERRLQKEKLIRNSHNFTCGQI